MTQEQWTAVDEYYADLLLPANPVLDAALLASEQAKLPAIQVAANQGKMLMILAQSIGARSILEIGTLGGYSTIWLAQALPPDGKLVTLEYEPKHADVARANIANAGFANQVEIRVGAALSTLPQLAADGLAPFDLVFIDADKANTAEYFEWSLKLTRRGSMIIVDNVVRNGAVADANSTDPSVQGIRRFNDVLAKETRVTATALQTVGGKGYDGLVIALVTG
jgi:predicted O-methyltransferase YrrM